MTPTRRLAWAGTPHEWAYICPRCGVDYSCGRDPFPGFALCPPCRPFVGPPAHLRAVPEPVRTEHIMTPAEWERVYDAVKASRMAFNGIDDQWEAPAR